MASVFNLHESVVASLWRYRATAASVARIWAAYCAAAEARDAPRLDALEIERARVGSAHDEAARALDEAILEWARSDAAEQSGQDGR
jgi:hypothetical protein